VNVYGHRVRKLEAIARPQARAAAEAALDALWQQFTAGELAALEDVTDADITAGRLTEAQRAAVAKWHALGGEDVSRRLWAAMTPRERAERMADIDAARKQDQNKMR